MSIAPLILLALLQVSPKPPAAKPPVNGAAARGSTSSSGWVRSVSTSKIDDSKTVALHLSSLESSEISLIIRCRENATSAYVTTGGPVSTERGDGHTVRIRFDTAPAITEYWDESTSLDALFSPDPIALAKRLAESSRLVFEFTPYLSARSQSVFDLRGLKPLLGEVSSTCHWPPPPTAEQLRRLTLQRRLEGSSISAANLESGGISLPVPATALVISTEDRTIILRLLIDYSHERLDQFYGASLELDGWMADKKEQGCWLKNIANDSRKLCVDLSDKSSIRIVVDRPIGPAVVAASVEPRAEIIIQEPAPPSIEAPSIEAPSIEAVPQGSPKPRTGLKAADLDLPKPSFSILAPENSDAGQIDYVTNQPNRVVASYYEGAMPRRDWIGESDSTCWTKASGPQHARVCLVFSGPNSFSLVVD